MERYFTIINKDTLEICLTEERENQPENSLPFKVYDFYKPIFNQYPNPTEIIEGATKEEIKILKLDKIKELKSLQFDELKLTDWYFIRLQETGKEVPNEVVELRQSIRLKYDELIKEL